MVKEEEKLMHQMKYREGEEGKRGGEGRKGEREKERERFYANITCPILPKWYLPYSKFESKIRQYLSCKSS